MNKILNLRFGIPSLSYRIVFTSTDKDVSILILLSFVSLILTNETCELIGKETGLTNESVEYWFNKKRAKTNEEIKTDEDEEMVMFFGFKNVLSGLEITEDVENNLNYLSGKAAKIDYNKQKDREKQKEKERTRAREKERHIGRGREKERRRE